MKTNYHTHTYRCGHAEKDVLDYVKKAYESNYSLIGIADHAPMPISGMVGRMHMDELTDYLASIEEAKKLYLGMIDVKSGLEIEYFRHLHPYYESLLEQVDYLLLAGHFSNDHANFSEHSSYACTTHEAILNYVDLMIRAMKTGYFTCLVHPDLFLFGVLYFDRFIKSQCERLIQAAIETNTVLEYNANGIRRGKVLIQGVLDYRYPREAFWRIAAALNAPVILGADAHRLSDLADETIEEAKRNIKRLNLNVITHLPIKKEH